MKEHLGILIDESRTDAMPEYSQYLVKSHYTQEGETIQEALARAAKCWSSNKAHAQRLYDYASKRWFMWSSPAFSNAIIEGQKVKAMPIACFLPYVGDTVPDLLFQKVEFSLLSVMGGGIGQYWGDVRPVSKKAPGPIPFIHEADGSVLAWKQGSTRRGALAVYLDIGHPDSAEFLKIRTPTGDSERKSLNLHHGYCIPDSFMQAYERGDAVYPLTNPSTGEQEGSINPVEHFVESVSVRGRTGEPFMYFSDVAYAALPEPQKVLGLYTHATNLCTEITLASNKERTPVCCLSSINLEMYPEFKDDPLFISDLIEMLDNILSFFVDNVDVVLENYPEGIDRELMKIALSKVKYSAMRERSLGLGAMGYSALLQSMGLPFESAEAVSFGADIFKEIKDQAHKASCRLGEERGVAPDIAEYIEIQEAKGEPVDPYWRSRRNLHLLAIAPTANNSVILATTPSTEPLYSNIYSQEMRIGTFVIKNKYLDQRIKEIIEDQEQEGNQNHGLSYDKIWASIEDNGGSIQHLANIFGADDMALYKTAMEIDQMWVVRHAAGRQPNICQAQSTNLFFPPGYDVNHAVAVHYYAWKMKLKSLYYYRTETETKTEKVSTSVERDSLQEVPKTIVYGTPQCSQCAAVKTMLTARGIEFEYIDLTVIGKTAAEVTGRPVRSVPQVYIQGEYVGGLKEVMSYLANKPEEETQGGDDCLACQG